jgi:hypothetical protein
MYAHSGEGPLMSCKKFLSAKYCLKNLFCYFENQYTQEPCQELSSETSQYRQIHQEQLNIDSKINTNMRPAN